MSPDIQTIVARLSVPTEQVIDRNKKWPTQMKHFQDMLGIRLQRNQSTASKYAAEGLVRRLISERTGGGYKIDHTMVLLIDTGDVMLFTQPYHHPSEEELEALKQAGVHYVRAHQSWGILHSFCYPDVYLIPRDVAQKESEESRTRMLSR